MKNSSLPLWFNFFDYSSVTGPRGRGPVTLLTLSWLISPIYPNAAKLDLGQKEAQKAVEPPGGTGTTTLPYFITVGFNPEVSVSKYAEPNDTFIRQRNV